MNTNIQNTKWRDLKLGEIVDAGDEYYIDGAWKKAKPYPHNFVTPETLGFFRTRRPLPNCEHGRPKAFCSAIHPDPIAAAIKQMEEAARVLMTRNTEIECSANAAGYRMWRFHDGERSHLNPSLSEALGYKSPEQEREEKIREAERLESEASDLFKKATELEDSAEKLLHKAAKLREEAINK